MIPEKAPRECRYYRVIQGHPVAKAPNIRASQHERLASSIDVTLSPKNATTKVNLVARRGVRAQPAVTSVLPANCLFLGIHNNFLDSTF